jgi:hypothetical protein
MSHPTGRIVRAVTTIVGLADDGKPANAAVHATCVLCHQAVRKRDLVFTRYAP